MSETEGDIGLGLLSLIIGIALFVRFIFSYILMMNFQAMIYKWHPIYTPLVYKPYLGTIDLVIGFFGFLAFALLATERGGAGGLFVVLLTYATWTAIEQIFNHFKILAEITGVSNIVIVNFVILGLVLFLVIVIGARASS